PGVQRLRATLGVGHQERQLAGADDWEAAGLVAGIDVGKIGDGTAGNIVVVEGFSELLGGIDFIFDGAAGILLNRRPPFLQGLLQRVRRWHPMRQLEFECLVLRERASCSADQQSDCANTSGETEFHGFLPRGWSWSGRQLLRYSAECEVSCKAYSLVSN